jgi:hypothetical protein
MNPYEPGRLSDEDALRLNVLMAGEVEAVRLDEGSLTLYALTPRGEARVALAPDCGVAQYVRKVREFLAGRVLGSPGGYPVFIQRWARMGQAREQGLDKLLLLGEPEAVVSVAYSPGLTDELARRAWWAMPTADNARRMLERAAVREGAMGRALAEFLVEHLPFETTPHAIMDSMRCVLQPGLLSDAARQRLWNKARHEATYRVAFLECAPDALPAEQPARPLDAAIEALAAGGNAYALAWRRVRAAVGQTFVAAAEDALRRPADQDVVNALYDAVGAYFAALRPDATRAENDVAALQGEVARRLATPDTALASVLAAAPDGARELAAMLFLARVDSGLVRPILRTTTAVGTLMRRKIEPVTAPIVESLACLRGRA